MGNSNKFSKKGICLAISLKKYKNMLLDRDEKVRWRRPLIGQSVSAIRASENVGEQGFRFSVVLLMV